MQELQGLTGSANKSANNGQQWLTVANTGQNSLTKLTLMTNIANMVALARKYENNIHSLDDCQTGETARRRYRI